MGDHKQRARHDDGIRYHVHGGNFPQHEHALPARQHFQARFPQQGSVLGGSWFPAGNDARMRSALPCGSV